MSAEVAAELEWGVRSSFLSYVEGLADGRVETLDGAVRDDRVFRFSGVRADEVVYRFSGAVRFSGYSGVLDVTLRDLEVRRNGGLGVLSADVAGWRLTLAELSDFEPTDGDALRASTIALTDDGAATLGGVYPAGTPAAPLTIRLAH
ncbi:HtaA domain-containing protein [Microbacterium yannicii]|uniref:HtaA domain-containing protein n=1 Tax=Microbacterium yannicii TaxID=671622 RepID=UPI0002E07D42|nr:HtaA domain-containing protein [Microbacterium yannicii]